MRITAIDHTSIRPAPTTGPVARTGAGSAAGVKVRTMPDATGLAPNRLARTSHADGRDVARVGVVSVAKVEV